MASLEKLEKRLHQRMGRAIKDFELIEEGDHILVCLSGGKDSYTLLDLLLKLKARSPVGFQVTAFHLDQKQPGYPAGIMEGYLSTLGIPYLVCEEDTYSVVLEKLPEGATPCSLCSRLRRGIIYTVAEERGCNKIALGHHRDDSIETLLLNLFHTGQLQGMPVRYRTDDGRFEVIRPLLYCAEDEIAAYAAEVGFPIIPCNLCGSIEGRRGFVKDLIEELEKTIPHIRHSMLAAMSNVRSSHLLDRDLLSRLRSESASEPQPESPPRSHQVCGVTEELF
jgi:tRNA 2-thiocytidine biosynthesis protein TtcA